MKTLLIVTLVSISTIAMGQAEAFFTAVEKQDMTSIRDLLTEEVELCIEDDDQRIMPKAKALTQISAFIKRVNPSSVKSLHSGSSGAGSDYRVAKLKSTAGVYRIFIYMEKVAGKNMIKEVRFDTF